MLLRALRSGPTCMQPRSAIHVQAALQGPATVASDAGMVDAAHKEPGLASCPANVANAALSAQKHAPKTRYDCTGSCAGMAGTSPLQPALQAAPSPQSQPKADLVAQVCTLPCLICPIPYACLPCDLPLALPVSCPASCPATHDAVFESAQPQRGHGFTKARAFKAISAPSVRHRISRSHRSAFVSSI